jgi:hypothetical protein
VIEQMTQFELVLTSISPNRMVNCTNHCSAIQQRSHNPHHIHAAQFPTVLKHGERNGEIGITKSCLDTEIN